MKIGSVKWWRHVIVGTVIGLIILFMVISICFIVKSSMLTSRLTELKSENEKLGSTVVEMQQTIEQSVEADASSSKDTSSVSDESIGMEAEPLDYQLKYEDLYVESAAKTDDNTQKIVYLTFDDGPSSESTEQILDILSKHNAKATFFVSAQFGDKKFRQKMYKRIIEEGHTIGLHTYSHNYEKIYASVDAYLKDMNKIFKEVYEATGVKPSLLRFPGGSVNSYNCGFYQELIAEVTRRGFTFHDWSTSSRDAAENTAITASAEKELVVDSVTERSKSVVLFHDLDESTSTIKSLGDIIDELHDNGYELKALDDSIRPFHFPYEEVSSDDK